MDPFSLFNAQYSPYKVPISITKEQDLYEIHSFADVVDFHNLDFDDLDCRSSYEWKKEFGIKGKLVSAYYNNQFLGNTDLALIFVIERPGSQNEFVGFTGNDIPIAASMIPALGKTIKIVQSNSNGTLGYNLQAIAE